MVSGGSGPSYISYGIAQIEAQNYLLQPPGHKYARLCRFVATAVAWAEDKCGAYGDAYMEAPGRDTTST